MNAGKSTIRDEFKKLRNSLFLEERAEKSKKIGKKLFSLKEFKKAKSIMFYLSFGSEVKTEEMIEKALNVGKKVVIPFVVDKKGKMEISEIRRGYQKYLKKGVFGIMEVEKPFIKKFNRNSIEMAIVPGIVFDKEGRRVGFGYGYYDRFLKSLRKEVPLVGLAYEIQIVEKLPFKKCDIGMNLILTEKKVM